MADIRQAKHIFEHSCEAVQRAAHLIFKLPVLIFQKHFGMFYVIIKLL